MKNLTEEEIRGKAKELSEKIGSKVTPFSFTTEIGEQVIGYISEPSYNVRAAAFDKMMISTTSAGEIILENCLIKDESHPEILNDEKIKFSAVIACIPMVNSYNDELRKKKI